MTQSNFENGFAALTFVLIVAAISLILGFTISQLSINEIKMELTRIFSDKAYYLATLCAEDALMKLKKDINYTGNEVVVVQSGECAILPIEGNWTVKTRADYQNQIKKIRVIVDKINPEMVIQSWEEVADF